MPFMPSLAAVRRAAALLACGVLAVDAGAAACTGPGEARQATAAAIAAFVKGRHMKVLTFAGYSGAGYERPAAMLAQAAHVLDGEDPARTLVNAGATAEGIGAVYELAKGRGYTTLGIVSTRARDEGVALSPCVDHVFFVKDATWGGRLPGRGARLSPVSAAIVANSAALVVIGGGDIARDEALAARRAGKPVTFIAADMNHDAARAKAKRRGLPEPGDFRGSAHAALGGTD